MVTIKDVAREAGVSIATVSRVINGFSNVNEETRKKVLRAIKSLGYKPMPSLRKASELLYTIGVLLPNLKGDHYNEILMAIEDYAKRNDFEVMVSVPNMLPEEEKHVLDQYFKRKIDGIILCELFGGIEYLKPFINSGIPIVALDYYIEEVVCDSVNIDNLTGAMNAMKYLYKMGHRKILYVRGPQYSPASRNREKGIKKFLDRHKDVEVFFSEHEGFNPEDGYQSVSEFLKKKGKLFTAVFSVNDWSAIGAIRALKENGLEIPEDVSIIGYDDAPYSEYLYPPLTTIRQPRWEMGQMAAQLLIDRILGKGPKIARNVILPTQLIERQSVKKIE
ncbi:LacI family DNA-binding transcriptional regulator [Fervidobacterium sp. 2310opik-2]|uniref:LacI family DNA-binding transcriptional regulator n=1 Tax=Fervidobacterium sp. 2310opik-2 TaxID=1755815 RepID=UPI0013DF7E5F|nr:LacI family DNA-binding transcriptional regulator [Fervidobacterium sp. 2310opik-2]KAF2962196.1 alanine racemase [Fervidobacterium sp. 2310opik-2]